VQRTFGALKRHTCQEPEVIMRIQIVLYIILLLLSFCGNIFAETKITCATLGEWPPMEYKDENGHLTGYTLELLENAGRIAGFSLEFVEAGESDILDGLLTGKYDAICSTMINKSLHNEAEKIAFTTPYLMVRQALIVNGQKKIFTKDFKSGKRFGAIKGTYGKEALEKKDLLAQDYDTIAKAMEDVFTGALDGVFCDEPVALYYAKIKYRDRLKVSAYISQSIKKPVSVAIRKEDSDLLQLLNKGIETLKVRRLDEELQQKWFVR